METSGKSSAKADGSQPHQFLELSAYEVRNPIFTPPPYAALEQPPSSGFRIPFAANESITSVSKLGPPVAVAKDGHPVYLGSAYFQGVVHPCRVSPHLQPPCYVSWGHQEHPHFGRFDVLPFDEQTMEWVPARGSRLPRRRRPVEGGYEAGGTLYHVLATVNGIEMPGKIGEHLNCAGVPYEGREIGAMNYKILCWRGRVSAGNKSTHS